MDQSKTFSVSRTRDEVVEVLASPDTLTGLLPGDTEIVERKGDRCTTRTRYSALGREGEATFHWNYLLDGDVRFEKVCDGNVWRALTGVVAVEEVGAGSRVTIEMKGRTRPLVPEFAIKGQLESQLEEMVSALRDRLETK